MGLPIDALSSCRGPEGTPGGRAVTHGPSPAPGRGCSRGRRALSSHSGSMQEVSTLSLSFPLLPGPVPLTTPSYFTCLETRPRWGGLEAACPLYWHPLQTCAVVPPSCLCPCCSLCLACPSRTSMPASRKPTGPLWTSSPLRTFHDFIHFGIRPLFRFLLAGLGPPGAPHLTSHDPATPGCLPLLPLCGKQKPGLARLWVPSQQTAYI